MNVTVAVYQERVGAELRWTTLGLGEHTQRERGPTGAKLQQKIANALREVIAKTPARDLTMFELVRGTRLEVVRLELGLRHEGRKRKVSLVCPLAVEPRWASDEARFVIAYHPARQERWFPVHDDMTLAEQAAAFFTDDWAELKDSEVDELRLRGRCVLKSFSFTASPRSLLDDLPDRPRGVWDDLRNDQGGRAAEKRKEVLKQVGVDVTWRAIDGSLAPSLPRSPFREQLRSLLCLPSPQPLLAVGPSGSGRTTLLERAAADLLDHDGYPSHRNADRVRHVWQVSGKRIIAGMSYLGDWQQRCLDLCAEARERRAVLWVTDLHHFGRVGRSRDSEMNLADFFQGPLARREVAMLGECTPEELRQLEEDAPAFAALFTRVNVPPAGTPETLRMLLHEVRTLEGRHERLRVHPSTLREILEVGAPLAPTRAQPGNAMDLLRQTVRDAVTLAAGGDAFVGSWQVDLALSARTGLPTHLLAAGETLSPEAVGRDLAAQVMGQRPAVEAAVDLVARIRAGLVDPRRPYAVYLFTGPTGTGKTELAKALARYLYGSPERLVRLDMGEYGGADAAARLVGDRWNPEGVLTRAVQAQPFCVVLLDEVEKAHPQVHNLLLQLFDEARLTDAAGAPASFAHAVVVMTSNLGARAEPAAGFGASDVPTEGDHLRAVRDFFPPELFNRIDRVVSFRPLTPEVARAVVARELAKLTRRRGLVERNVFVTASDAVLDHVVREAFRAADGARSLKRWLEDRVGTLLTEHLVESPGGELRFVRLRVGGGPGEPPEERAAGATGGAPGPSEGASLALSVEALREAEPMGARFPLEECLTEPLPRLQARLADARRELDALAASPALAALSERIHELVARHRRGEHDEAGTLHTLESLRGEIAALGEHLEALERAASREEDWDLRALELEHRDGHRVDEWTDRVLRFRAYDRRAVGGVAPPSRAGVLSALAEVAALRRALRAADDPSQHAVTLELERATPAELQREGAPPPPEGGLFEQLPTAYARARGALDEAVVADRHGASVQCRTREELWEALHLGTVERVTLKLSGLGVRDFFAPEHGTHVWRSLAGVPEIVRVRVLPAAPEAEPSTATLPLVRSLRFDPPSAPGAVAPLEIEDYPMGVARTASARALTDPLGDLWLLRIAREEIG